MVENFDEWLAICQNFPYQPLSLNVSPLKPTINSSQSFARQTFVLKFLPIKLLHYIVYHTHICIHTHESAL